MPTPTRRQFLGRLTAATLGSLALGESNAMAASGIGRITCSILERGRDADRKWAWFHPRACMIPSDAGPPKALMTMQSIGGSDYFGPVHWMTSNDLGQTWTEPKPIAGLGRHPYDESDLLEGVCDVSPDYHPKSNRVLAIGHNVYYERGHLARPQRARHPVYTVLDADGRWSKPAPLVWDDPRGEVIYTSGCGQRIMLPDGDVLLPLSFGAKGWKQRRVSTALCGFDGHRLAIKRMGSELSNTSGRGLLEPSLVQFGGRTYMTIRAEDGRGYVSVSDDGLRWSTQQPWAWDDGEPLTMSTTQQHWLAHRSGLFLVYTRKAEHNINVMRWRAPIFMAAVDPDSLRLVRDSERVVLPLLGDGVNDPDHVARMGNFHVTQATPDEAWVTVGECLPNDGWRGNLLLARIEFRG